MYRHTGDPNLGKSVLGCIEAEFLKRQLLPAVELLSAGGVRCDATQQRVTVESAGTGATEH